MSLIFGVCEAKSGEAWLDDNVTLLYDLNHMNSFIF